MKENLSLWDVTWGYYTLVMPSISFKQAWDKLWEEVIPNRIISIGLVKVYPIAISLEKKNDTLCLITPIGMSLPCPHLRKTSLG